MASPGTFVTGQVLTAAEMNAINEGASARPLLTGGAYIDGTDGLVLSGLSGNFASTPDSAALSITGDIDIKCKVTLADWTPSAANTFLAKWQTSATRSYAFDIVTDGRIRVTGSSDGSATFVAATSTVATGVADGATKWVRATIDVDNGSGSRVGKFYLSDDGTTWTQLGTTVTNAGTVSFFDSTSQLEVGSTTAGTSSVANGTFHRVIIQDAFDTADNTTNVVFDADFEAEAADTLAFTEDSSNAATVSVTTTRYTYGIPGVTFTGQNAVASSGVNVDIYSPFLVTRSIETDMAMFEATGSPASTSTFRAAIYNATDDCQPTGAPLVNVSTSVATAGVYRIQWTPVTLPPGRYVIGHNATVSFNIRAMLGGSLGVVNSFGSSPAASHYTVNRTNATFPTNPPNWNSIAVATQEARYHFLLRWKAA